MEEIMANVEPKQLETEKTSVTWEDVQLIHELWGVVLTIDKKQGIWEVVTFASLRFFRDSLRLSFEKCHDITSK